MNRRDLRSSYPTFRCAAQRPEPTAPRRTDWPYRLFLIGSSIAASLLVLSML